MSYMYGVQSMALVCKQFTFLRDYIYLFKTIIKNSSRIYYDCYYVYEMTCSGYIVSQSVIQKDILNDNSIISDYMLNKIDKNILISRYKRLVDTFNLITYDFATGTICNNR